jgi:hypothetical protein
MINKEVCDKVKEVLSMEGGVLAIINNGSAIVGMDAPDSDIDFVVITATDKDEKSLVSILRKKFRVLKNEEHQDVDVEEQWEICGRRADFTFRTKKAMDEKVDSFYDSVENYLKGQHFIKHKIVDAVAVYDPKNILAGWKKKAEKYPKKIMKDVFYSQIRSIKENLFYWRHHKFRNEFQFGFEEWDVMKAICQALYAKNNQMFMLPYKRIHKDLKELKPNIEKEMYELVRGINNQKMIENKIKVVERILEKLER